jgi:hypothetical protein
MTSSDLINVLPAALSAVAAFFAWWTAVQMNRAEFRPRLRVGLVTIQEMKDDRPLASGLITLDVGIVNVGRRETDVIRSHCEIYVGSQLPMHRPYQGKGNNFIARGTRFPAGDSRHREEKAGLSCENVADITTGERKLFVMGYIQYSDRRWPFGPIKRRTMFCLELDTKTWRFVPVKDPDYVVEN